VNKPVNKFFLCIGIIFLFGCTKQPSLAYYTLEVSPMKKVSSSQYKSKVIKVLSPQSLRMPLSQKMLFSYSLSEQGVYQNSQWRTGLSKLLEGVLIQTLEESGVFSGVIPYSSTAIEHYRLESMLFVFSHKVRGKDSAAVVSIHFSDIM
jgi:ABC-type uncharacterized transport system auxiliary subunit